MDHLQRFASDYLSRHSGALEEADAADTFWKQGAVADLIPMQDQRNAETFREAVERPIRERTRQIAKQRDAYCRELLEARITRRLHWLINHPRLLKRLLRVVKRWEPTLTVVDLRQGTGHHMTAEAAVAHSEVWVREREATGFGYVFTYTDPSGLPAEIYGPVA